MVERVRINSSQIILKDSYNRVSFDTANFYLKTDPNGQLKAGGYAEVPSIWGYNDNNNRDISNKPVGWYAASILSGIWNNTAVNLSVPVSTATKLVLDSRFTPYMPGGWKFPAQTAVFNGTNTNTTFRWVLVPYQGTWFAGIEHFPNITNVSGTWTYPASTLTQSDAGYNITAIVSVYDYESASYNNVEQNLYTAGWPGFASTYLIPMCIMTLRNPVTLSVAPTL